MLGHVAGFVAHELRNPLTTIALYGDILESHLQRLQSAPQAPLMHALHIIRQEVTRLDALMQHYLWLARLPTLLRTPTALDEFLETWTWKLQGQLVPHRITLQVAGLKNLGVVALHKAVFQQLLQSLVQRAISAMPQGGVFTVHGRRDAAEVYLTLSDTGNPIPAEQLARLFECPIPTASEKFDLSLYMVYAIMSAHEGIVSVVSEPGKDTTFTLTLPASPAT
jgi:signal transduction histidine kinase